MTTMTLDRSKIRAAIYEACKRADVRPHQVFVDGAHAWIMIGNDRHRIDLRVSHMTKSKLDAICEQIHRWGSAQAQHRKEVRERGR